MQRTKKSPLQSSLIAKPQTKDSSGRPAQPHTFKAPKTSAAAVRLTPGFAHEAPVNRNEALQRFKTDK